MDEEKINEVCVRHGCIKLKLSKRPSWIDKTGLEGIEYDGFSIKPFWSIDGEREYDREPGQKIDDILDELNGKKQTGKKDVQENPELNITTDEVALYHAMRPPEPPQNTLNRKLLLIQEQIGVVIKNNTNPFFKSKYADINEYLRIVKPILNQNGIVLLQPLEKEDDKNILSTILLNADDGDSLISEIILPSIVDPQKFGAAVTYFRRFAIQSILALQAEDSEGNGIV